MKVILILLLVFLGSSSVGVHSPLESFLESDTTNQREYTDEYNCGYFCRDLVSNSSSVEIGIVLLGHYQALNGTNNHAMCYCFVEDELIIIEPQTDELMNIEDTEFEYYQLFPTGHMVPSSWSNEFNATKVIR